MKLQFTYSKLKRFLTCPKQYQQTLVLKTFKDLPNQTGSYGKDVHKSLEAYVKTGTSLPENYKKFQRIVDHVKDLGSEKYTELQLAFNQDNEGCPYYDPDYLCRGIVDLLLLDGEVGWMFDYKLGKSRYYDLKQLSLLSLLVFANFPQVNKIRSGLLFLSEDRFIPNRDLLRSQVTVIWESFIPDLTQLVYSYKANHWPAQPSGLCRGWCPVKTCEHYRDRLG